MHAVGHIALYSSYESILALFYVLVNLQRVPSVRPKTRTSFLVTSTRKVKGNSQEDSGKCAEGQTGDGYKDPRVRK